MIAPLVHVWDNAASQCRVALVMGPRPVYPEDTFYLHLRVFVTSSAVGLVGAEDREGTFAHYSHHTIVWNQDGSTRALDSWHRPGEPHDGECTI